MCWRVFFLQTLLLTYLPALTFVELSVPRCQYFFMFNKIPLKPPLNKWWGCQVKHSVVCGVKGKFTHTVKALHFAFERLDCSPSSNDVVTCWVSFTALTSTRANCLCSVTKAVFNSHFSSPLSDIQWHNSQTCADPGKSGKAGENH